ncbi:MAG: hypothetical protein ACTMIA_15665 [Vibrio sp.]
MKTIYVAPFWRGLMLGTMLTGLFMGAFIPAVGKAAGPWHIELHFLAFVIVGSVIAACLWQLHGMWHCLLITAIPIAHEVCEIWGHHHGLEHMDIVIDIGGGIVGVIAVHVAMKCCLKRG